LAACPQQVKDGVDDGTKVGTWSVARLAARRQNRCNPGLSRVSQVGIGKIGCSSYRARVADERPFKTNVNFSNTL